MLDANGADDAASAALSVTAPARLCTVPKVTGLSTRTARSRLAKAGCKLGKVTFRGRKARRGQHVLITAQYVPARIRVARGTKIAVTTRAKGRVTGTKHG